MEIHEFLAPGGLFETSADHFALENDSVPVSWMETELDPCTSTMSLFGEVEGVQEVQEHPTTTDTSLLSSLISECGIPGLEETTASPCSPSSSMASDMETHQSLIEELEDFFGSPTVTDTTDLNLVSQATLPSSACSSTILEALSTGQVFLPEEADMVLTEEALRGAVSTTHVTEDGQTVIIIVAPASPAASLASSDTDPEWEPQDPLRTLATKSATIQRRKKYARSKPPSPPPATYPKERKERKKAQNRTAAFRYREKKKGEAMTVDEELEGLAARNATLRERLTDMEKETRLLKSLMVQMGITP